MSEFLSPPVALAVAAHPDDIEFCFAGTLLLLKDAGCEIHMWNLARGDCGSRTTDAAETARIRLEEARASAGLAGATSHDPLFDDLSIFYDKASLARVSSILRTIHPQIILTHSPADYMEDHQNVCRLVVTAAFSRGMPNHACEPPAKPCDDPVRVYHAAPHGHHDGLGAPFAPDFLIDIQTAAERKRRMLACHRSQARWLEDSQGMGSYLDEMEAMDRSMAGHGRGLQRAEGWRRHAHLGFCPPEFDPIASLLPTHLHSPTKHPS